MIAIPPPNSTHPAPRQPITELDESPLEQQTARVDTYVIEHLLEFAPYPQFSPFGINRHLHSVHLERERIRREPIIREQAAILARSRLVTVMKMTFWLDPLNPGPWQPILQDCLATAPENPGPWEWEHIAPEELNPLARPEE
ncbi:MAG: hypothetical protein KGJ02_06370 [Verrucomicrobiota bacterium]|nr:hypothetical protein [Verrucomicrobiota bacterium]